MLDQTGVVQDAIDYDASGNITAETAPLYRGDYTYTGRLWVQEVGLQNNRGRWYDPETDTWISEDPKGFDAGDPTLNAISATTPECH